MKLETYLTRTGKELTDEAFATAIGCSQSQINRLRRNKAFPSPEMVAKIHEATNGEVSASDWYDLPEMPRRSKSGAAAAKRESAA